MLLFWITELAIALNIYISLKNGTCIYNNQMEIHEWKGFNLTLIDNMNKSHDVIYNLVNQRLSYVPNMKETKKNFSDNYKNEFTKCKIKNNDVLESQICFLLDGIDECNTNDSIEIFYYSEIIGPFALIFCCPIICYCCAKNRS